MPAGDYGLKQESSRVDNVTGPSSKRLIKRMIERTICILAAAMLLPGCSPTYNWREVMLEGALVKLMLPCKPDSGKRELPLVHGQRNWVHMVGCETGGLTFSFAWADVKQVALTSSAVTTWQRATLEQLKVNVRTEQPITISGVGAQKAASFFRRWSWATKSRSRSLSHSSRE